MIRPSTWILAFQRSHFQKYWESQELQRDAENDNGSNGKVVEHAHYLGFVCARWWTKWKEATVVGLIGFFAPSLGCSATPFSLSPEFVLPPSYRKQWGDVP